ncbi:M20 family metallo-hydrolase [Granulicella tundricola]|uniref:Amidase, hydantoinase/carbamoylase family n=1 Tax=Granulicella tundricola (strain ATCC BAA-1859 / DSM 23138 / MP5ACTX9) TaxID=1198114 RepID=E8WYY3_GRATM|nr:M20 family metallo-hydrolase [Granulicella tundricola]ADW69898.1 amidase, hydantoinase/carbamoylase family [Granulicella tundricola MP5ACTX9]
MSAHVDGARVQRELEELARFTHVEPSSEGTAVTRVVFTDDDLAARTWLIGLAEAEGFAVRVDAVGNTFIRLEGADPSLAAVATGSHIDAIPHAGMYDGTVGVIGGLEALRAIKTSGVQPKRAVELILFTSEEPTRFGIGCLGSRLMAGTLSDVKAGGLIDLTAAKGEAAKTLDEVRTAAGFTGALTSTRLLPGHYAEFVELHIEQGPLLERDGQDVGIVTSIAAPASYRFVIEGFGGHAGALLMPDRRDALCAASEVILAVERSALTLGTIDTVATVGTCGVYPGAVNSVPSKVALELDLRDTDPRRRGRVMDAIRSEIAAIETKRGVRITETLVNEDVPAACGERIVGAISGAAVAAGMSSRMMVSRAYHDTLFMAQICPVGMIFIPCRGGVSHRPDEFATVEGISHGTQLLTEVLTVLSSE